MRMNSRKTAVVLAGLAVLQVGFGTFAPLSYSAERVLQGGVQQTTTQRSAGGGVVLNGSVQETVRQMETEVDTWGGPGIVGLDLMIRPGQYAIVKDVFRFSPAYQAGIKPGDRVLAVDGYSTMGKTKSQVDQAIPDTPHTNVKLTIARGQQVGNLTVTVAALADVHPALQALYASAGISGNY